SLLILLANSLRVGKSLCCNDLHHIAPAPREVSPCPFRSESSHRFPKPPPASPTLLSPAATPTSGSATNSARSSATPISPSCIPAEGNPPSRPGGWP